MDITALTCAATLQWIHSPTSSFCPPATVRRCAAGQNKLLALNYIYPGEDPKVCVAHAAWGEAFEAGHTPMPPRVRLCTQAHTFRLD